MQWLALRTLIPAEKAVPGYEVEQALAERFGYSLVGILPAIDRDMVSPGNVKRVDEGMYAKVLVGDEEIFLPPEGALTPKAKALWNFLLPGK